MRCSPVASRSSRSSAYCSRRWHRGCERLSRRCARLRLGWPFRAIRFLTISLRSIRPLFWTTATRNRCALRNASRRWKPIDRYGSGGWRGLSTPRIQVHRFVSQELTDSVKRLWDRGIENPEVRDLLLQIVAAGKLTGCADIAHAAAMDESRTVHERRLAIVALLQLNDPRLEALTVSIEIDSARWSDELARHALLDLFPSKIPVPRLSQILRRVKEKPGSVDLSYRLPREIEMADLSPEYIDQLRQALTDLIIDDLAWERDEFPHLRTKRPDLVAGLVAACRRQA